ncbi:hypothetical protein [Sphingomonas quercus]|uniref:EpsG family protein n=1 Tax=Sphingomonas quercus TaxID=2842451 RepID=A0ABS6BFW3_9SPHN|nr:hypothetical protein [Sphingomonas quercus]MBU3077180.1 hypothetical protein [Sphingomonas quercus]
MRERRQSEAGRAILLALIAGAAVAAACRKLLPWAIGRPGASDPDMLLGPYRRDILWPNYVENGFIRRGLGGTLMELLRDAGLAQPAAGYQLLTAILLVVPLTLLLSALARRGGRSWLWFGALLVMSPQLFLGWGTDFGRGDMLTISFIAWAAVALAHRRHWLAVAALLAGTLAHETALFYGVPLVAAFAWRDHRTGRLTLRQAAGLAALLMGGVAVLILAQRLLGDSKARIAETILAHDPVEGASAAYMTVGGLRTLFSSACISFGTGHAPFMIASCVVVLALYMAILLPGSRRDLALLAFVSFLPFAAMSVVAVDYGRWLMLAVITAWLSAILLRIRDPRTDAVPRRHVAIAAMLLLLLLPMRTASTYFGNDAARLLADRMLGPSRDRGQLFEPCDPGWRSVLPQSATGVAQRAR